MIEYICVNTNDMIKININMIGNNTNNHDNGVYPALQNVSNNHVQNKTYNILNINIFVVFGTTHE